jgi:opacity protein-like surface antigen
MGGRGKGVLVVLLVLSCLCAAQAHAGAGNWSIGLEAGQARLKMSEREWIGDLDIIFDDVTAADRDFGQNLHAGYRLADGLWLNVSYSDFGTHDGRVQRMTLDGVVEDSWDFSGRLRQKSMTVAGHWPVAPHWEVIGEAGAAFWQLDARGGEDGDRTWSRRHNDMLLGIGLQWNVVDGLSLRARYTRAGDHEFFSLGYAIVF